MKYEILRKFGKNFLAGVVFLIFLSLIFAIAGAVGIQSVANLGDIGAATAVGDVGMILFAIFSIFAIGIISLVVYAMSSRIGGALGLMEQKTSMPTKIKIVSVLILGLLLIAILGAFELFLTGLDQNYRGFSIQGLVESFTAGGNAITVIANIIIITVVGTIVLGAAGYFGKISAKAGEKGINWK